MGRLPNETWKAAVCDAVNPKKFETFKLKVYVWPGNMKDEDITNRLVLNRTVLRMVVEGVSKTHLKDIGLPPDPKDPK